MELIILFILLALVVGGWKFVLLGLIYVANGFSFVPRGEAKELTLEEIERGQASGRLSKAEVRGLVQKEIERREKALHYEIHNGRFKTKMAEEKVMFDCGRENFNRIKARYKHDDAKFGHAVTDWLDYMDAVQAVVYDIKSVYADLDEEEKNVWNSNNRHVVKVRGINKRFRALLHSEFVDPVSILRAKK